MISQALFAGYDPPLRVVDGADFDGTNDYMARGADLTGAADSKIGILSAWIRLDAGDGDQLLILDYPAGFRLERRFTSNKFRITGRDVFDTILFTAETTSAYTASSSWLHVLSSWDVNVPTYAIYVNDVLDTPAPTGSPGAALDLTEGNVWVGCNFNQLARMNGAIADLYFAPGQYLDFSLVSNRRKFISASGKPVHLGTNGSLPTGTAPIMYHHIDDGEAVANFATNRGTGGNFTITGTLDTASSSPSD